MTLKLSNSNFFQLSKNFAELVWGSSEKEPTQKFSKEQHVRTVVGILCLNLKKNRHYAVFPNVWVYIS